MTRKTILRTPAAILATFLLTSVATFGAYAQNAARFLGSITAINGNTLTVKTDAGEVHEVAAPETVVVKRIEPGQTNLSTAATITLTDLTVGDRVLVLLDTSAPSPTARQIVAIKAADMAQKQQKDREDWQRRGIAGLVKGVDTSGGAITVGTGAGPTAKTVTVKITQSTVLKRYAASSVSFDQAQVAPISAIHEGDQLRAKGDKNADGSEITAEEVVSGTFKNLSGTIASIDTAAKTVSIKDLATKKNYTIHIGADAQMHRIPDQMAQTIAARLKSGAQGGGGQHAAAAGPGSGQNPGGNGRGPGGGDTSQFLSRTPAIQLSDLQKGQAVMVVASDGATDVNAIMLLAGVEPLLEAPAARDLLSSWSMGGGEGAAGVQ